jgi:hypothetical protein
MAALTAQTASARNIAMSAGIAHWTDRRAARKSWRRTDHGPLASSILDRSNQRINVGLACSPGYDPSYGSLLGSRCRAA